MSPLRTEINKLNKSYMSSSSNLFNPLRKPVNIKEEKIVVVMPDDPTPDNKSYSNRILRSKMITENLFAKESMGESATMVVGVSQLGDDDDHRISKSKYSWVRKDNSFFITARPNVDNIPAGLYDIKVSMETGVYLEKRSAVLDELFYIPDETMPKVVKDMEKFWNSRDKYDEYGITYKRGILMYGPPGTGKSSIINLLINQVVTKYNGIVLNVEDIDTYISMAHNIRCLEPDKPILTIIEDLDSFIMYNSVKKFLNVLDGNMQVDNVVYLATTNYLERLEDRIKNRPSRFDTRIEIGYPSAEAREYYLKKKLKEEDLTKYPISQWVADTDKFTYSHLRELICSVVVMDNPYNEVLERLKSMYEVN